MDIIYKILQDDNSTRSSEPVTGLNENCAIKVDSCAKGKKLFLRENVMRKNILTAGKKL